MIRIVAAGIALFAFALALGLDSRRAGSASDSSARAEAVGAVGPVSARDDIDSDRGAAATPASPAAAAASLRSSSMPTTGADAGGTGVAQSTAPASSAPIAQTLAVPQPAAVPLPKPAAAATTATRARDAREETRRAVHERQLSEFQREAATAAFAPNEIVNGETVRGGGVGGSGEMTVVQPAGAY